MYRPTNLWKHWRWLAVAFAALALAVIVGRGTQAGEPSAPFSAPPTDSADALGPPSSPDFNLAISTGLIVTGASEVKDPCNTLLNEKVCVVHPGEKFTVRGLLDSIEGLPDTDSDTTAGYLAYGIALHYSPNLTRQDRANECAPWPDFDRQPVDDDFDASDDNRRYNTSCFAASGVESIHTGAIAEVDFVCPSFKTQESITIVHGDDANTPFDSALAADDFATLVPEEGAAETIIINCDNNFVWDVNEDGSVQVNDIFEVVLHFGEVKPTP